jgi:hypothetical protein
MSCKAAAKTFGFMKLTRRILFTADPMNDKERELLIYELYGLYPVPESGIKRKL